MALSSFLPWASVQTLLFTMNRNAFQLGQGRSFSATGAVLLLLGIVTALIGITCLTGSAMPRFLQRSPIVTGAAALLVAASNGPAIQNWAKTVGAAASVGFGVWVAVLAGLTALAGGIVLRPRPVKNVSNPIPPFPPL